MLASDYFFISVTITVKGFVPTLDVWWVTAGEYIASTVFKYQHLN